jgi:hypothetical protein
MTGSETRTTIHQSSKAARHLECSRRDRDGPDTGPNHWVEMARRFEELGEIMYALEECESRLPQKRPPD